MAKVSVGLRGWRFEESEIFTEDGEFRPLEEIPKDPRHRLVRLHILMERPCDACYLVHGEEEKRRCRQATIVYGEPLDEVVLCDEHETDFLYWFREAGGEAFVGEEAFRDEFHEWFAAGNRAPEGYGGLDHVDTDPENMPDPPGPDEIQRRLDEARERDAREGGEDVGENVDAGDADDLDPDALEDLNLDREYPGR